MIPYKSPLATAVPNSLEVRLEIVKAMRTLLEEGDERLRERRAEIASIRQGLAEIAQDVALLRREAPSLILAELRKYGYNPDEPRVPKHSAGGGEWTRVAANDDSNPASDAPKPSSPILFQRYGRGHHWVGWDVYSKFKLKEETRRVFEDATSGQLADPSVNYFNREHRIYNRAVEKALRDYLIQNNITDDQMTPEQAEDFYRKIRGSNDPVIGGLNRKVIRERLRYIEYFYLRGSGGDEE
jgi:hypothetical protein